MVAARPAALLLALLTLAPALALAGALPGLPVASAGPAFAPRVDVGPGENGAEPGIAVDKTSGCLYIDAIADRHVWRSCDGLAFHELTPPQFIVSGLDADVAVDAGGNVWFSDLWLGSGSVTVSTDHGQSWTRNDPVGLMPPGDDREWLAPVGNGMALHIAHQVGAGLVSNLCLLGPAAVGYAACAPTALLEPDATRFCVCPPGHPGVSPDGQTIVVPYALNLNFQADLNNPLPADLVIGVAVSHNGGLTWSNGIAARGAGSPGIFPWAAVDAAGNAYVAWAAQPSGSGPWDIYVARSFDGGNTWDPGFLDLSNGGTNVMPTIAADGNGHVGVAWYHTNTTGDPESLTGLWYVDYAESSNAASAFPAFAKVAASPYPNHRDSLSISGLNGNGNRNLLDYFGLAFDAQGHANIAYADDYTGGGAARVYYVHQVS